MYCLFQCTSVFHVWSFVLMSVLQNSPVSTFNKFWSCDPFWIFIGLFKRGPTVLIVMCKTYIKWRDPNKQKNLLQNTTNFNCGLSDVHNIISAQMKSDMPSTKKPFKTYRSYKQLNEEKFLQDLEQANLTQSFKWGIQQLPY